MATLTERPSVNQARFSLPAHDQTATAKVNGSTVAIASQTAVSITLVTAVSSSDVVEITYTPVPNNNSDAMSVATRNLRGGGSNFPSTTTAVHSGTPKTWASAFSVWSDYNAVSLVLLNHTAIPAVIDNISVAASATAYPGGVFNIRAPTSGWSTPTGQLTVPAGTAKRPGILVTPKIYLKSIPRAGGELDGGKFPLVFVAAYTSGNTACYADLPLNFASLYDPINEGFSLFTADPAYGYDAVTDPTGWVTSTREATPAFVVLGAVLNHDQKVTTVLGIGDSIMQGAADGASNRTPFLFKATARIRAAGKRLSYFNGGISGSTYAEIFAHGKDLIASVAPDVLVLASYTINSSVTTQAAWDNQWGLVIDLASAQVAAGKQVLLLTPLPNDSFSTAQNSYRLIQRQRVINSGLPYVDVESLADSGGHWATVGMVADGTHPLNAGHEAIAKLVQPALDKLIA